VAASATDVEVLRLIEDRRLWGRGLGWIDAHLLAAALVSHCRLWTLDKRLASAASELGLS
jgi:predicted nucleic acid-binding protein